MRTYSNHSGFTLIELSIVLVIIGMLIGLGSGMIGPLTTFVKVRETRELQDSALQSITSWASSRNSIPDSAGFPTVAKSPLDAWGRNLIYLYDANLYAAAPTKDTICGRRLAALTLVTTDPAATMANVAFVVLSGAENATLKSTLNGNLNGVPLTGIITATGYATGTITVTGPNSDLVRWVTLDELRSKIGCQGAPLKIVNNELPFSNYSASYSATIVPDGGTGAYEWRIKKGSVPTGMSFSPPLPFVNSSTSNWASGSNLTIQGWPRPQGSYNFTIMARDSNGNSSSRLFVLTIQPK